MAALNTPDVILEIYLAMLQEKRNSWLNIASLENIDPEDRETAGAVAEALKICIEALEKEIQGLKLEEVRLGDQYGRDS